MGFCDHREGSSDSTNSKGSGEDCSLPKELPQTIEDAIIAVKELGESYVWVDKICVAQEDEEEKMVQIQNMDRIYSNAIVTLVAGESSDSNAGLPGVRPNSRSYQQYAEAVDGLNIYLSTPLLTESIMPTLNNSNNQSDIAAPSALSTRRWISRGWTFQEGLLSPRCLIFTATQVFWKCMTEFCCDSLTEAPEYQRKSVRTSKNSDIFATRTLTRMNDLKPLVSYGTDGSYFKLVQSYSLRKLMYDND